MSDNMNDAMAAPGGVWPGVTHPPITLTNPAIISVPLAFVACWLGSLVWPSRADQQSYPRFSVTGATGIQAEEPALARTSPS
jgi:cation/acetate symporter